MATLIGSSSAIVASSATPPVGASGRCGPLTTLAPVVSCLIDTFSRTTASGAAGTPLRGLSAGWYDSGTPGGYCNGSSFVMNAYGRMFLDVGDQTLPFECLVDATISSGGSLVLVGQGSTASVELDVYEVSGSLEVDLYDSGTATTTAFVALVGTPISIRFRYDANTMMAKIWASSGAEPGTWTVTLTDTGYLAGMTGSVEIQMGNFGVGTPNTTVTHFEVTTGWPDTSVSFAYGSLVTFDDFNRSVSANGWGTPSGNPGNPWSATVINWGTNSYLVNGSQGVINSTTGTGGGDTALNLHSAVTAGQFIRAGDGVVIQGVFTVSATNLGLWQILSGATATGPYETLLTSQTFESGAWDGSSYNYKAEAVWGWYKRWKGWKVGGTEPGWTYVSGAPDVANSLYLMVATQGTYTGSTTTFDLLIDSISTTPVTISSVAC